MTVVAENDPEKFTVKSINKTENEMVMKDLVEYLFKMGYSESEIQNDITNIDFFSEYLAVNFKPERGLLSSTSDDVIIFLNNWYPKKMYWAAPDLSKHIKDYITSFEHFFHWLFTIHSILPVEYQRSLDAIKTFKVEKIQILDKNV